MLKSRLIFQINGDGAMPRSAHSLELESKADSSSETGEDGLDGFKLPGSNPNENLQILSKEKRLKISWRSKTASSLSAKVVNNGINLDSISSTTIFNACDLIDKLPSSKLASFL